MAEVSKNGQPCPNNFETTVSKQINNDFIALPRDAPLAIYEIDLSSLRFKWVNQYVTRLLGYTETELLDLRVQDLLCENSIEVFKRNIALALNTQKTYFSTEVQVKTKGGCSLWGLFNSKVVFNEGKPSSVLVFAQDITESKKVEKQLRESEHLYRTLFESTEDGFELVEPLYDAAGRVYDERILGVNRAFEKQTGLTESQVLGRKVSELNPDRESYWFEGHDIVLKTGRPAHIENYVSYTKKFYDAYVFPYSASAVGILFRDITERKKTEEALIHEKAKAENYLNIVRSIVVALDSEGKITLLNDKANEILEYAKGELLGKDWADACIPREMRNEIRYVFNQIAHGNLRAVQNYENSIITKNGSRRTISWHNTEIRDINGSFVGTLSSGEDITERREMEKRLSEEKRKYQDLTETTSDFIWEMDARGRYTYCSPQMEKLWSIKPADMIGKTPFDLMPASAKEAAIQNFIMLSSDPRPFSFEVPSYDGLGNLIFLDLKGVPFFNQEGVLLGFRGISRDITERKKAEDSRIELEKRAQENERLAAIGATAGMVGHDIRNPLQAITGDIYLLNDNLAELPDCRQKKEMKESLESITANVIYINKIVADLQDYARPLTPEYSIFNLPKLIEDTIRTISLPDNVNLSVKAETIQAIKSDQTYLRRSISNLVNNAIQAMPNGGILQVACYTKAHKIYITVSDTGVGIPESVKAKLFTPMMTTKAKGQGLGLAVAKRLVEALKGTIRFESEEGKGTNFIIELSNIQ